MKAVVAVVLIVSAALLVIITLGGWERLQSPSIGLATIIWAGLYVVFALLVMGWNRGILPVCAALAMLMAIFAGVSAPAWFARDKDGLTSPAIAEDLLGLLTLLVIPLSLLMIVVALLAFNQEWHVEEERPIAGGPEDHGDDDGERVYAESDEDRDQTRTQPASPPTPPARGGREWSPPSAGATPTA